MPQPEVPLELRRKGCVCVCVGGGGGCLGGIPKNDQNTKVLRILILYIRYNLRGLCGSILPYLKFKDRKQIKTTAQWDSYRFPISLRSVSCAGVIAFHVYPFQVYPIPPVREVLARRFGRHRRVCFRLRQYGKFRTSVVQ